MQVHTEKNEESAGSTEIHLDSKCDSINFVAQVLDQNTQQHASTHTYETNTGIQSYKLCKWCWSGVNAYPTQSWSFWRWSSQPITWL